MLGDGGVKNPYCGSFSTKLPLITPIVPERAGGGSFRGEEPISQRKNLPIECTQGGQPVRFPVCSDVPSCGVLVVANFVSGGDLMCCGVMWYDVVWLVSR